MARDPAVPSWAKPSLNWLLVMVPVSLLVHVLADQDLLTFVTAAVAIVPLAGLIGRGTEQLALHAGPRVGGLLNATFGNVTELIIAIFLILRGELDVVKASLTGSILGNLLLVLGLSFLIGAAFLGPEAGKLGRLLEAKDPDDPEVVARVTRIIAVARADVVLLLLVAIDMVAKPFV